MIDTIAKLHQTGFVFYEGFLFIFICLWFWIMFLDGARKFSEGVISFWGKYASKSMYQPIVIKIIFTVSLIALIGGGYGIILNKLSKF